MEQKMYPGHVFLARLGKKRLRPGGKIATDWLFEQGQFESDKKILEVACNMGTTSMELATKYNCNIIGVDFNEFAVKLAKENVAKANLENKIEIKQADARNLPFEDNTFDIVINEAMLTMHDNENKSKCLSEYYRVLKPGGILLTHDVLLLDSEGTKNELSEAINLSVTPLAKDDWKKIIENAGFINIKYKKGPLTLMTPQGMIYDEGFLGTLKIFRNAMKKENRFQFKKMFKMFRKNRKNLNYIAIASYKGN